jgi:uncharacterized membrane protein YdjX (TVP38/TMEM64 family)
MRLHIVAAIVLLGIIGPFVVAGEAIDATVAGWLAAAADRRWLVAAGVVLLLAFDVFLPVPSSAVSTGAGALLGLGGGALASLTGMTLGAAVAYAIGRVTTSFARRLVPRRDLDWLASTWARHGDLMVVLARPVPVLAESSAIFAGLARMPFGRFLVLTLLANTGISMVYAWVGAHAADTRSFLFAFAGAVLLPVGPLLWYRRSRRTTREPSPAALRAD